MTDHYQGAHDTLNNVANHMAKYDGAAVPAYQNEALRHQWANEIAAAQTMATLALVDAVRALNSDLDTNIHALIKATTTQP